VNSFGFVYNDGGRKEAGFNGYTGDCVIRAIAIATGKPYREVYDTCFEMAKAYVASHNNKVSRYIKRIGASPRNGVDRMVARCVYGYWCKRER